METLQILSGFANIISAIAIFIVYWWTIRFMKKMQRDETKDKQKERYIKGKEKKLQSIYFEIFDCTGEVRPQYPPYVYRAHSLWNVLNKVYKKENIISQKNAHDIASKRLSEIKDSKIKGVLDLYDLDKEIRDYWNIDIPERPAIDNKEKEGD